MMAVDDDTPMNVFWSLRHGDIKGCRLSLEADRSEWSLWVLTSTFDIFGDVGFTKRTLVAPHCPTQLPC